MKKTQRKTDNVFQRTARVYLFIKKKKATLLVAPFPYFNL